MDKADLTGESSIHNWVDKKLEHSTKVSQGENVTEEVLPANHLTLTLIMLLPFVGVLVMENATFGGLRRNGIIFDWILGGLLASLLMSLGFLLHQAVVFFVGLSLFLVVRIAVVCVGNDHIRVHNNYLRRKLAENGGAIESNGV